jgi:cyclopropane-fatty-acyl-phospholipid synthase
MATAAKDIAAERTIAILRSLFGERLGRQIGVRLWDGTELTSPAIAFTLAVNAPYALRAAFTPPLDLNPAKAFVHGWIDVDGDLETALDTLGTAVEELPKSALVKLAPLLLRLPKPPRNDDGRVRLGGKLHSRARDAAAIGFHYDQPASFYRAFLGPNLVYSCAYWDDGVETLDEAQDAKLDYVLDKLRLRPGQSFLDIGCGWGSLVVRAAQRGTRAYGITLSRSQHEEAVRRIAELGLGDRARVDLRDYRELGDERFDAIASVGMVEHVGRERLPEYFASAYRALRDGGLFLNHGIVLNGREGAWRAGGSFVGRYVFPDGDLLAVDVSARAAERAGFEVRDMENLREHYTRTLRAWVANMAANRQAVVDATDSRTERIWRIYMAGSARGFALGRMGLMQTLLAKPHPGGRSDIPSTRRDLYRAHDDGRCAREATPGRTLPAAS